MLVAFNFSSMTCFRMTREDLMASFSVMDCKTNGSNMDYMLQAQDRPLSLPSPKSLEPGSQRSSLRDLQHPRETAAGRAGISTGTVKPCLSEI